MEEKTGIVKKIEGDYATLEVKRSSACGSCEGCAMHCEEKKMDVIVKNTLGAKVGDIVRISTHREFILKALILLYFIPFLAFCGGIAIGWFVFKSNANREFLSFILGLIFLGGSYFAIRFYDKKSYHDEIIAMESIL